MVLAVILFCLIVMIMGLMIAMSYSGKNVPNPKGKKKYYMEKVNPYGKKEFINIMKGGKSVETTIYFVISSKPPQRRNIKTK